MEITIEMVTVLCAACGMPFAITKDKEARLRECHNKFYCPDGHSQNFAGKTEVERLRERVISYEAAELRRANMEQERLARRRAREAAKKQNK